MWICSQRRKYAADIGALESVSNLHSKKAKAQINKLSKAKVTFLTHSVSNCGAFTQLKQTKVTICVEIEVIRVREWAQYSDEWLLFGDEWKVNFGFEAFFHIFTT